MPGAGHLVHMPAHIFFRLGRYRDAAVSNERAIAADEAYIARYKPEGPYPMMYYPHNIHFLWACQMMEGAGRGSDSLGQPRSRRRCPTKWSRRCRCIEGFVPTRLFALARFQQVGRDPGRESAEREVHLRRRASGTMPAAWPLPVKASAAEAEAEAGKLREIRAATPEDKMLMQHHARDLLAIAANHLDGTLLADAGKIDDAAAKLRLAVDQARRAAI